ncbi:MAG: DUF5615 family PIN-like protein [Chloroflexi bacterium]|nr:DUF5615 family PIN-like protein [Chloroflexota bacterium]
MAEKRTSPGHRVTVPADVALTGADDEEHFAYARAAGAVLVTFNPDDFIELHERTPDHPGVFVAYQDNDPTRDMDDLVRSELHQPLRQRR